MSWLTDVSFTVMRTFYYTQTHGQSSPNHLHPSPAHSLEDLSSNESLDDVGNYDDEDEGDIPPPLPPKTEDALILVDPPPIMSKRLIGAGPC